MEDRYPYIRFVIDAAQLIAGAVGVVILLGGTISSCHHGGVSGFISFVLTVIIAAVAYIIAMVEIEVLKIFVDVESNTRQTLAAQREASTPSAGPSPTS